MKMPTIFGTKEDKKDPGPWPHKILEIGMVASKKKLCSLCEAGPDCLLIVQPHGTADAAALPDAAV